MARKKMKGTSAGKKSTAKSTTKSSAKTQPKNISATATLEKSLRTAPAAIVAHYRKELATQKQLEKKLKASLQKAQKQKKTAKTKHTALVSRNKTKPTASLKKQLLASKKMYAQHAPTIDTLNKQLSAVKDQSKTISENHNKFSALTKLIAQFEKNWEQKQLAQVKAKSKAKKSTKSAKKPALKPLKAMTDKPKLDLTPTANSSTDSENQSATVSPEELTE